MYWELRRGTYFRFLLLVRKIQHSLCLFPIFIGSACRASVSLSQFIFSPVILFLIINNSNMGNHQIALKIGLIHLNYLSLVFHEESSLYIHVDVGWILEYFLHHAFQPLFSFSSMEGLTFVLRLSSSIAWHLPQYLRTCLNNKKSVLYSGNLLTNCKRANFDQYQQQVNFHWTSFTKAIKKQHYRLIWTLV